MISHISGCTSKQQESEVDRTPDDSDKLVPSEQNEHTVHPHGNLRDGADHAPLGLEVVGVCLASETGGQLVCLGLGEDDQGRGEVKVGRLCRSGETVIR